MKREGVTDDDGSEDDDSVTKTWGQLDGVGVVTSE